MRLGWARKVHDGGRCLVLKSTQHHGHVVGVVHSFGERDDASASTLAKIVPHVDFHVHLERWLCLIAERRHIPEFTALLGDRAMPQP